MTITPPIANSDPLIDPAAPVFEGTAAVEDELASGLVKLGKPTPGSGTTVTPVEFVQGLGLKAGESGSTKVMSAHWLIVSRD
jgi:hypothetical protein